MKNSLVTLLITVFASIYLMYVGFAVIGTGLLGDLITKKLNEHQKKVCKKIKSGVDC